MIQRGKAQRGHPPFFSSVSFCSANPGKVISSLSEVELFLRLARKLQKLFV